VEVEVGGGGKVPCQLSKVIREREEEEEEEEER
jgi:hypothetical protein